MEHLTVRANGAAFHVARSGKGPALLLLHGWPEYWLTWEPVMTRLAERYTLFAPDLRGFGWTVRPRPACSRHAGAHGCARSETGRCRRP